eukprot:1156645-Pelagomonas_calceolata.AAC.3
MDGMRGHGKCDADHIKQSEWAVVRGCGVSLGTLMCRNMFSLARLGIAKLEIAGCFQHHLPINSMGNNICLAIPESVSKVKNYADGKEKAQTQRAKMRSSDLAVTDVARTIN